MFNKTKQNQQHKRAILLLKTKQRQQDSPYQRRNRNGQTSNQKTAFASSAGKVKGQRQEREDPPGAEQRKHGEVSQAAERLGRLGAGRRQHILGVMVKAGARLFWSSAVLELSCSGAQLQVFFHINDSTVFRRG